MIVSEETNEFAYSDMYGNDDLIAYPNSSKRPKLATKTFHAAGELAGNPNDTRRTRSHLRVPFV